VEIPRVERGKVGRDSQRNHRKRKKVELIFGIMSRPPGLSITNLQRSEGKKPARSHNFGFNRHPLPAEGKRESTEGTLEKSQGEKKNGTKDSGSQRATDVTLSRESGRTPDPPRGKTFHPKEGISREASYIAS